ncbi:MAG: hypothetical protein JXR96_21380 [Deltaproteobacteria bacterium]|nr:hypothetical protein [Deltaproteobacteria bacterium]
MKRHCLLAASGLASCGVVIALALACQHTDTRPDRPLSIEPAQLEAARPAVDALQQSRFDDAEAEAKRVLAADPKNPQAHLVSAITHYKRTMHGLVNDLFSVAVGAIRGGINQKFLDFALKSAAEELAAVEADLAAVARYPDVTLDLCLACWEVDWNRSGRIDDRDRMLLQVEVDADGHRIPEGDPRRRPTFHFDIGDVYWARAMLAFQQAAIQICRAYRLPQPAEMMQAFDRGQPVRIQLVSKELVGEGHKLILAGLDHADRCRREYLAEKDDDREWVPNPRQKNHPLPLPVDELLYSTWEGVLADVKSLLEGSEGISVAEVAQLGDHRWADPPTGFIDVRRMLESPGDIVLNPNNLEDLGERHTRDSVERVLRDVLGDKYVPQMKPSQLISRMSRMKSEIERGEESLERKLRYLIWLN